MTEAQDNANRRNYFRVEDTVQMAWHPVSREIALQEADAPEQHDSERFRTVAEMQRIDTEARYILRVIAEKDRNVADYLRMLNHKVDLLARLLVAEEASEAGLHLEQVNLSEGGIEFHSPETMQPGNYLAVQLVLPPDMSMLHLFGRIAHSIEDHSLSHVRYRIGLEFVRITDADRQQIARHGMHVQTLERRARSNPQT